MPEPNRKQRIVIEVVCFLVTENHLPSLLPENMGDDLRIRSTTSDERLYACVCRCYKGRFIYFAYDCLGI